MPPRYAGAQAGQSATVLRNVRIFDGQSAQLVAGTVLVAGDRIADIQAGDIVPPEGATVIDGQGNTLMPGLTDAHWHMTMAPNALRNLDAADTGLMYAYAVAEAERTLMRGFTTVRDTAGPVFGLKQAIDAGAIPGPRVYPSGALISQTGGHGDFNPLHDLPPTLGHEHGHYEMLGAFLVANGVPEVMAAARQQLRQGASQVKIAVGGGVISDTDPIDTLQYSPEEIAAIVQVTRDWGTYVAAHVYTPEGIDRALDGGVLSIEHGQMASEDNIRRMAELGAWLSSQTFEAGDNPLTPEQMEKAMPMVGGWQKTLGWAKQHGANVAWGTDLLFQPEGTGQQNTLLTRLAEVFPNAEVLSIATRRNCELFALSGLRNPYGDAKLGVVERGAWADLLLVRGDPLADINILQDPDANFAVIMKGGQVFKNTL